MTTGHDDTLSTEDDGLLAQLRAEGILGPFVVVDWAAGTDVGLRRGRNEDRWGHVEADAFFVADGVGGNAGGELAAQTAVAVAGAQSAGLTETAARDMMALANAAVIHAGDAEGYPRLGTTLVVLSVHENHVVMASVGDSRAYRLRDGELEQLSRDHTVRNELEASGIAAEQVSNAALRLDALTSYLGLRSDYGVTVHVATHSIMAGDRFLVCTDGVHGQLDHDELVALAALPRCADAVEALLSRAREHGGRDNATAILVSFGQAG